MATIPLPALDAQPTGLGDAERRVLELWWRNTPLDFKPFKVNFKIPLPKPPGPSISLPIDEMTFPVVEWNIPILHEGTWRRNAIFIYAEPDETALKYVAYSTQALIYQFPDKRITSATLVCIRLKAAQIEEANRYGIGLALVPVETS